MSSSSDLILAIDTSGADAGLVLDGGGRIDVASLPLREGGAARTEDLAARAEALFLTQQRSPRDLTLVAGVVGPGSYTGLRSGLAFLRGLAFAGSLPAVAVGTLELLVWRGAEPGEEVVALWPAGKGLSTLGSFVRDGDRVIARDAAVTADDDGCARLLEERAGASAILIASVPPAGVVADAARASGMTVRVPAADALACLATLVRVKARRGELIDVSEMLPVYVGLAAVRPAPALAENRAQPE